MVRYTKEPSKGSEHQGHDGPDAGVHPFVPDAGVHPVAGISSDAAG
jgi:hypothetical protein